MKPGFSGSFSPTKRMPSKEKSAVVGKKIEGNYYSVTLLHMDGTEKRPLLAIGRFMTPRCFRGVKVSVDYKANAKAWMTSEILNNGYSHLTEKRNNELDKSSWYWTIVHATKFHNSEQQRYSFYLSMPYPSSSRVMSASFAT